MGFLIPNLKTAVFSCVALVILLPAAPVGAQVVHPESRDTLRDDRNFSFYDRGPYREAVPRPEMLLGYQVGARQTQHAAQEQVLLAIAEAASDRVLVEEIGRTHEGRVMRVFVVTSASNRTRLESIRSDLDLLSDPRGKPPGELEAAVARTPAVVMTSASVHGDEVPGFEASMQLLYHIAASEEPATLAALESTVVVINPSSNPDGHERFAVWYNSLAVASPEPAAMEQQGGQPWSVRGRYNHYRFDLNRDVFAGTQPEVRAIVGAIHRWKAMVHIDLHGYTDPFYFTPPARPINANLPESTSRWLETIGRGNAEAFDRYGWLYFVRDVFDLYYPGYWDTWPSLTGAAGMTYETDGGPALLKRRHDGTLLSLRDGIAKHYVASLAAIETVASRSRELVGDYLAFRQGAVAAGREGAMKGIVWLEGDDPVRAAELAAMLLRNGIEVRRTNTPVAARRARSYATGSVAARRFDAGAYVVDLAQPLGRLARALLEPDPVLDSSFVRTQLDRFRRNVERARKGQREDYEFYDVTAWSLPLAFGVEAYWTEDAPAAEGDLLILPDSLPPLGEALPVVVTGGVVRGAGATTAYLFSNARQSASRLAGALLNEAFRVAVSSRPLDVAGETWPRGTFVVHVSRNAPALHARIDALAREAGVDVVGVNTAFPAAGQYSIGSETVVSLKAPKIALVGGEGVSPTGFGSLWWTLEHRYRLPITTISTDALHRVDLSPFNAIVIPPAEPDELQKRLGNGSGLKKWVEDGGTLVTMEGATAWAARDSVNLTSARTLRSDEEEDEKPTPPATSASDTTLGVRSPTASTDQPEPLPGSLFDIIMNPLARYSIRRARPDEASSKDGSVWAHGMMAGGVPTGYYSPACSKGSQADGSPVSKPVRSHCARCSEEPWVKDSGWTD